jgi:hypothetical protein
MYKKFLFITLLLSILSQFSCDSIAPKDFDAFAQKFVDDYRPLFPDESPLSMDNDFLGHLAIPTPSYLDSVRDFQRNYSAELKQFDRSILPTATLKNVQKVDNILKTIGAYLVDYPQNPQRFNVLHGFRRILKADYASDDYRLQTLLSKLEQVPLFYNTAKERLHDVNRQSADAAVEQHLATFLFFDKDLPQFFKDNGRVMPPQYQAEIEAAKLSIKDYVAFVESFRLN